MTGKRSMADAEFLDAALEACGNPPPEARGDAAVRRVVGLGLLCRCLPESMVVSAGLGKVAFEEAAKQVTGNSRGLSLLGMQAVRAAG
ncbi:MAG: hypothetical protein ABSE87_12220 [Terracidiphilus sp.]